MNIHVQKVTAHALVVVGRPIVSNVLAGLNSCVLAYGATSSGAALAQRSSLRTFWLLLIVLQWRTVLWSFSADSGHTFSAGKTHTMLGDVSDSGGLSAGAGLAPRIFERLFAEMQTQQVQLQKILSYDMQAVPSNICGAAFEHLRRCSCSPLTSGAHGCFAGQRQAHLGASALLLPGAL